MVFRLKVSDIQINKVSFIKTASGLMPVYAPTTEQV